MYDDLKNYEGKIYTGMKIGGSHKWQYDDGVWYEIKKTPERWEFKFDCKKTRMRVAPTNTGANLKTKYHWYIIADQIATKINSNEYLTSMKGLKFKIGHKRPHWKTFSYNYPEQTSYKQKIIKILEDLLNKLKVDDSINEKKGKIKYLNAF